MGRYENGDAFSDEWNPYYTPEPTARPNIIIPIDNTSKTSAKNTKTNEL